MNKLHSTVLGVLLLMREESRPIYDSCLRYYDAIKYKQCEPEQLDQKRTIGAIGGALYGQLQFIPSRIVVEQTLIKVLPELWKIATPEDREKAIGKREMKGENDDGVSLDS